MHNKDLATTLVLTDALISSPSLIPWSSKILFSLAASKFITRLIVCVKMMGSGQSRYLFTALQLEEFKHQALIYNYMVSGVPVPTDLLSAHKRKLDFSSTLFLHKQGKHYKYNILTSPQKNYHLLESNHLKIMKQKVVNLKILHHS